MSFEVEYVSETGNLTDEFYSSFIDPEGLLEKWFLYSTPFTVSTIILYLLFIYKLGPTFMENRSPYKLNTVMRIYNLVQIYYNGVMIYNFLVPHAGQMPLPMLSKISCSLPKPFDGIDQLKYMYLHGAWYFQLLKIIDLLDTIFMVLRKRTSHVTFLHVYHHVCMVFFPWFTVRFIKATQGVIPVFINLNVHVIMYSYYFLATFPVFRKYLWWKHHLTKLQLLQFVFVMGYIGALYYYRCPISKSFTYIWLFNVFIIFSLFLNFYIRSYLVKKSDVQNKNKSK